MVVTEEVSGGEGNDPETDDQRADSEDPVARVAILGGERGGFTNAEDLAANANGHEESAEDEGGPSHGLTFLP